MWSWAASPTVLGEQAEEVRAQLLRHTYRLTAETHAAVYEACAVAMQRLGIEAVATLYQAGETGMNAALHYLPGEIHIVFNGAVLEKLSGDQLLALLGHELAHYRLWSEASGDFYTAERILQQTALDPTAANSHHETARRYRLHTEIYADRGAAAVAGVDAAIETLVRVQTGLAQVDAQAFLRQAEEVASKANSSEGHSHPETYLRAQALERWGRNDAALDPWLVQALCGPLDMACLDLLDQRQLSAETLQLLEQFMALGSLVSEPMRTQAAAFFPELDVKATKLTASASSAALGSSATPISGRALHESVGDYFGYVLLDLLLADGDASEAAYVAAGRLADTFDSKAAFFSAVMRDAGLSRKALDALARELCIETPVRRRRKANPVEAEGAL